jgi:pimeloyl-ACP methyl ester carboxylesterase
MEAFRAGSRGIAWEGALLARPWGFSIDAIRCPVLLWHGEADREVPVAMARQSAARLPTVRTWFLLEEGHFSLPVRHQHAILGEVKRSIG